MMLGNKITTTFAGHGMKQFSSWHSDRQTYDKVNIIFCFHSKFCKTIFWPWFDMHFEFFEEVRGL